MFDNVACFTLFLFLPGCRCSVVRVVITSLSLPIHLKCIRIQGECASRQVNTASFFDLIWSHLSCLVQTHFLSLCLLQDVKKGKKCVFSRQEWVFSIIFPCCPFVMQSAHSKALLVCQMALSLPHYHPLLLLPLMYSFVCKL